MFKNCYAKKKQYLAIYYAFCSTAVWEKVLIISSLPLTQRISQVSQEDPTVLGLCASQPSNKITFFQVLDCLSFHPPPEYHLPLPLFCHNFPLPSHGHMSRMTKMILHKNSPGFFPFFFFFLIFFLRQMGRKSFQPHTIMQSMISRGWLFHQNSSKWVFCYFTLKKSLL